MHCVSIAGTGVRASSRSSSRATSHMPCAPVRTSRPAARPLLALSAAASADKRDTRTAAAAVAAPSPSCSTASSATKFSPPASPRGSTGSGTSSSSPWLASAIKEAVRGIDDAPFLLLGNTTTAFTRHPVSPAVVAAPSLWPGIAAVVAGGGDGLPSPIMLVHPLAEGSLGRVPGGGGEGSACAAPASPLAGVAANLPPASAAWGSSSHHLRLADTSRLMDAGLAVAEVAGRVGDACCDEEGEAEEDAAASALPAALNTHASALAYDHPAHEATGSEPGVAYYGVVVLSGDQVKAGTASTTTTRSSSGGGGGGGAAGCYVLKTVRAPAGGGCSCVYFTLTRVYKGEPLAAQLVSSWLA